MIFGKQTLREKIRIGVEEIENTEEVAYLGSTLTWDNNCRRDIKIRLAKGKGAMSGFNNVWKSKSYGLYSAFMGCFVYIFLGTAKDITLGPTAIMSLLTGQFGVTPVTNNPTYAILLSLIGGIIQTVMGILHIGFLVDYISHPVINSFTTAAAITIAWGQLKSWWGLKNIPSDFNNQVVYTLRQLPQTILWDFLMGFCCVIALFLMKQAREINWGDTRTMSTCKRTIKYVIWLITTSRNAIVVVVASGVSAGFLMHNLKPFTLTGTIKAGLPDGRVPSFTLSAGNITLSTAAVFADIGEGLIVLPVLGIIESIAIGKAFARKNNYEIDADQELLAIGIANIVGSFVGAYPVTGSFSRTAVNSQSGVRTPMGGVWTAVLVLLALAFLTPLFYYIPTACLSAVIIMAVLDLVDFSLLPKLWKIKKVDLFPWIVTFVCCLAISIEYGIIIGVGLSLLMLLCPFSRPQVKMELSYANNNRYEVLTVDQGLMFPGIRLFTEKVNKKALKEGTSKSVIIDMSSVWSADYTSVEGVEQLIEDFTKQNKQLIFCNMRPHILDIYKRGTIKHFVHASNMTEAVQLVNAGDEVPETNASPIGNYENVAEDESSNDSEENTTSSNDSDRRNDSRLGITESTNDDGFLKTKF